MLKDIVEVRYIDDHKLFLRFEDGLSGEVDLSGLAFDGVFEPLKDLQYFARVELREEHGTICWPNGADLDPDVLYSMVAEQPIPDLTSKRSAV